LVTGYQEVTIFVYTLLEMKKNTTEISDHCKMSIVGIRDVQDIMGGKWKYMIVTALYFSGKMKFMDLKRLMDKIAPKVLSKELKDLERSNLVTRTVCDTKPITVEYELTDLGDNLNVIIRAMGDWGLKYRQSISRK